MYTRPSSRIVVVATVDLSVIVRGSPVSKRKSSAATVVWARMSSKYIYMIKNYNALSSNRTTASIDKKYLYYLNITTIRLIL